MATECWRPLKDWPYEVSDRGRVRRAGRGKGTRPGRVMRPQLNKPNHGYLRVVLRDGGRSVAILVHRLVAVAFIGPLPEGHEVDHIDGDHFNNCASNLRYLSRAANAAQWGTRNANARLTPKDVQEIRSRYARGGISQRALAAEFGVAQNTVKNITLRLRWRDVA